MKKAIREIVCPFCAKGVPVTGIEVEMNPIYRLGSLMSISETPTAASNEIINRIRRHLGETCPHRDPREHEPLHILVLEAS